MKWLALLISIAIQTNAFAWGNLGHKIVAQYAEGQITPKTKMEIARLLVKQNLVDVCVWADQVRKIPEYSYTAPWHYADVEDGHTYQTAPHDPKGDVVVAITEQSKILKSPKSSLKQKIEALKFITHFMGDIHQPLHVGRPHDHGGNSIQVIYLGKEINLHSLWDSEFINEAGMTPDQYSEFILKAGDENYALAKNVDLIQVTNEDLSYRKFIYSFKKNEISDEYARRAKEIVNERLKIGGERLANLLNSIFDN